MKKQNNQTQESQGTTAQQEGNEGTQCEDQTQSLTLLDPMACQQRQKSTCKKPKLSDRMKSKGKVKRKEKQIKKCISSEVANLLLQLDDELSDD